MDCLPKQDYRMLYGGANGGKLLSAGLLSKLVVERLDISKFIVSFPFLSRKGALHAFGMLK